MRPLFVTGANAKIIVNGVKLAYCTDLSYTVEVNHAVPRVLGMYEGVSLEPISYIVSGAFTVVRYVRGARENLLKDSKISIPVNANGNGLGNFIPAQGANSIGVTSSADRRVYDNLDPASLESGNSFSIEVVQDVGYFNKGLPDPKTGKPPLWVSNPQVISRIRNARIFRADATLNKRSAFTERYGFLALYLDEDSFIANPSGYYGAGNRWEKGERGESNG